MSNAESEKLLFEISGEQYQRYSQWRKAVEERIAKEQLATGQGFGGSELRELIIKAINKSLEKGEPKPYYGSIENIYVFSFIPNNTGMNVTVKNCVTGDEINLTNSNSLISSNTGVLVGVSD